jgi:hypothetical protein
MHSAKKIKADFNTDLRCKLKMKILDVRLFVQITYANHFGNINEMVFYIVMFGLEDNDPRRITSGKLALQVHQGPEMLVQFKDIRLREF